MDLLIRLVRMPKGTWGQVSMTWVEWMMGCHMLRAINLVLLIVSEAEKHCFCGLQITLATLQESNFFSLAFSYFDTVPHTKLVVLTILPTVPWLWLFRLHFPHITIPWMLICCSLPAGSSPHIVNERAVLDWNKTHVVYISLGYHLPTL